MAQGRIVQVADTSLQFRPVTLNDDTPTGRQLLMAAGIVPAIEGILFRMDRDGELALHDHDAGLDLRDGDEHRFVATHSDRILFFAVDGIRHKWAARVISGRAIRTVANVPPGVELILERADQPDHPLQDHDLVRLGDEGVERLRTERPTWKFNVHGVVLTLDQPEITARAALERAGFDPEANWKIVLVTRGGGREPKLLDDVIDLRGRGIEKLLRLPGAVNNGEAPVIRRRDFALKGQDADYLDRTGLIWECVQDGGIKWLRIEGYPLPSGYTASETTLLIEMPTLFPQASPYGFYSDPPLCLNSGHVIPSTQMRRIFQGRQVHGWSRRASQAWNPQTDGIATHLGLVEAALLQEVGQ